MQPGQASGGSVIDSDESPVFLNTDLMVSTIKSDAQALGFEFNDILPEESCPVGTYKVAFVIDNQKQAGDDYHYDYHFYRQNSDGSWSHKPGGYPVTDVDASGEIIMDPRTCDRNSGDGLNYNLFVGFYAVRPLNIYYQGQN